MSKIVKKKDLDVLIESTLEKAGIKSNKVIKEAGIHFSLLDDENTFKEYEDENLMIIIPKNFEDMCAQGSDTKWCVSHGRRFFDQYNGSKGNLRVYINKKTNKKVIERIDNGQLFDENDREINELPTWAQINNHKGDDDSPPLTLFALESKSLNKSLINEELARFNKLTNYTYKK